MKEKLKVFLIDLDVRIVENAIMSLNVYLIQKNNDYSLSEQITNSLDAIVIPVHSSALKYVLKIIQGMNLKLIITFNTTEVCKVDGEILQYIKRNPNIEIVKFIKLYDSMLNLKIEKRIKMTETLQINVNGILWCVDNNELMKNKTYIKLTNSESKLLNYLRSVSDYTINFSTIEDGGLDTFTSKEQLKQTVKRLNKKLGTQFLVSVYGIGYKINKNN